MTLTARTGVQFLGQSALAEEINIRLRDLGLRSFRCAVGFARWSGLHLIDAALRAFAGRKGSTLDCLVGVDLGGTTIEALTYLSELPNSRVRVVRSGMKHVVFHPKVYAFEGAKKWSAIVGSDNLSTGGLYSNIESYVILEGDDQNRDLLEQLFEPYDNPPFTADHVREVDSEFLEELAADLARYSDPPPDRHPESRKSDPPPMLEEFIPPRPAGRPPEPATAPPGEPPGRQPVVVAPVGHDRLYMELWDETGGGTQVQIAKRVFSGFFGASPGATTYVTLDTPGGRLAGRRLQWFSNVTFRIGLPFVGHSPSGSGRQGVLRFTRLGPDHYEVELRMKGHRHYDAWLRRCDDETGAGRKHWGIH